MSTSSAQPTIVSNGRRGYTAVPNFRTENDPTLDIYARAVAIWISTHTDSYRGSIGRNEIARRVGLSAGKASGALEALAKAGIVTVEHTLKGLPTKITFNVEVWETPPTGGHVVTTSKAATGHVAPTNWSPGDHKEEQGETQVTQDTCSSGDERPTSSTPMGRYLEQFFLDFWSMYPRRVGKPAAKKALRAALRKGAVATVIEHGLGAWIEFWKASRTEPGFIPYPATWLNQERWNDAPPPLPEKPVPAPSRADDVSINLALDDATEFFVGRDLLQWRHEHIVQMRAAIRTMHNWGFELGETMIRIGIAARRPSDMIEPSKLAKLPRVARFAGMPPGDLSEAMECAYRNLAWRAS